MTLRCSKKAARLRATPTSAKLAAAPMDLRRLDEWLTGCFSAFEMLKLARFGPAGATIYSSLSESDPPAAMSFKLAMAWDRHGVSSRALLEHLAEARPNHRSELRGILVGAISECQGQSPEKKSYR